MSLSVECITNTNVPIEVEGVVPSRIENMSLDDVRRLVVFHGNEKVELDDLFNVTGDTASGHIEWHGDLAGVHWIGAKMVGGQMRIYGNAGRHIGSEMTAGEIYVDGDAGDWVGGEMRGGLIHVRGRAGHLVGAAYRGSRHGMRGGTILIGGDAGNEVGHTMRRGLIAIGGSAGDLAGFNMLAGTIFIFGDSGIRYGAGMRRGTIGLFGHQRPQLLPSFRYGCTYRSSILGMLLREVKRMGLDVSADVEQVSMDLYHGDLIEGGRGEVFVRGKE